MLPRIARRDSVSLGFETLSAVRPMTYDSQAIAIESSMKLILLNPCASNGIRDNVSGAG